MSLHSARFHKHKDLSVCSLRHLNTWTLWSVHRWALMSLLNVHRWSQNNTVRGHKHFRQLRDNFRENEFVSKYLKLTVTIRRPPVGSFYFERTAHSAATSHSDWKIKIWPNTYLCKIKTIESQIIFIGPQQIWGGQLNHSSQVEGNRKQRALRGGKKKPSAAKAQGPVSGSEALLQGKQTNPL